MTDRTAVLGGVRTRVVDEGTGPTVVLVHGTPFDLGSLAGLAARLRGDHRVLRYDVRGHGAAAGAAVGGPAVLARDLVDLLDGLGVGAAHVAGHSFGGTIAQRCALDHPTRVRRLSLVCTRASPFPAFGPVTAALRAGTADREASLTRWFDAATLAADGPVVRDARATLLRADPTAWADALAVVAVTDLLDELPALRMPVDVVAGEHDHGATPEHMAAIAAAVPGSRFHVVPGVGHLAPLERPDAVAALLR